MTGTKSLPSFVLILLIPLVAAVVLPIGNLYTSRILPPQPFALTPPAIWLTAAGTVLVALCFCRRLYFAAALGSALLALGLLHLIARQGESYPIGSLPAAGGWISLTALVILIWRSTDQCRPAWRCALYGCLLYT
ncbi:MAG: hypothetical protein N3A57_05310, partial [Negativicutes bacterium]|nr:hypothetical protein [Negativicutes bacterium]